MATDPEDRDGLEDGGGSRWDITGRTPLQTFVHHQNLALYVDQLEGERDPGRRATLKRLLLEEEDRYGSCSERLDRTDLLIRRGQARLARQKVLIAELDGDGRDTARAEAILANMILVLEMFEHYRQHLSDAIDRSLS